MCPCALACGGGGVSVCVRACFYVYMRPARPSASARAELLMYGTQYSVIFGWALTCLVIREEAGAQSSSQRSVHFQKASACALRNLTLMPDLHLVCMHAAVCIIVRVLPFTLILYFIIYTNEDYT